MSEVKLVDSRGNPILVESPSGVSRGTNRTSKFLGDILQEGSAGYISIPSYYNADEWMIDLVRGTLADDGFTPIKDSDLSSVVTRRQTMASTWEVFATGRTSPLSRFKDIFDMANDGQGGSRFASYVVGSLDTTNRGAFIALIPIDSLPFDSWSSVGIEAEPVDGSEVYHEVFVDGEKVRNSIGLWSLDPLDCWPTGDARFPYWFQKDGHWFLIPRDLGFHIEQPVGGKSKKHGGWGQCGTWRYIGNVVTDQLIRAMEFESLINEPPRAIIGVSGVDYAGQFEQAMEANANALSNGDALLFPGRVFFETVSNRMDIKVKTWTEAPAGYDPSEWRIFREDALTASFHMSVSFLRTRIGTGSFSQSDVTAEIQSETGVAWARSVLESIYNRIIPRVTISVVVPSDKATKRKYERFNILSEAIKNTQDSVEDDEVLTKEEIRQLIQDAGIEIKNSGDSTSTAKVDKREGTKVQ